MSVFYHVLRGQARLITNSVIDKGLLGVYVFVIMVVKDRERNISISDVYTSIGFQGGKALLKDEAGNYWKFVYAEVSLEGESRYTLAACDCHGKALPAEAGTMEVGFADRKFKELVRMPKNGSEGATYHGFERSIDDEPYFNAGLMVSASERSCREEQVEF